MEKLNKLFLISLAVVFSIAPFSCSGPQKIQSTPTAQQTPDIKKQMYFKSGRMIECDTVWEGYEGQILCKQSEHIKAYSAGDVDLIRTFGERTGKDIGKRYEEGVKKRELMSKRTIVTPEQERYLAKKKKESMDKSSGTEEKEEEAKRDSKCFFGISEGDWGYKVIQKCGEPTHKDSHSVKNGYWDGEKYVEEEKTIEEWHYDFGRNQFVRIITLVNGIITAIETGGYGGK